MDDQCPDCGVQYPVMYGPHPTWIPCGGEDYYGNKEEENT